MLNRLQKNNKGFTIIEVMIVLAIAGLIILVVLLAVPALQRNSRNTAIKNDAAAIAGAVSEFSSNNDGAMPTNAQSTCTTGSVTLNNSATAANASSPKIQGATTVNCQGPAASPTAANYDTPGELAVVFGARCTSGTSSTLALSGRAVSIVYLIETSSSTAVRCLDA